MLSWLVLKQFMISSFGKTKVPSRHVLFTEKHKFCHWKTRNSRWDSFLCHFMLLFYWFLNTSVSCQVHFSHRDSSLCRRTDGKIKSGSDGMGETFPWKQEGTTPVGIVSVGGTFAQRTHKKQTGINKCFHSHCKHILCLHLHSCSYVEMKSIKGQNVHM